MRFVPGGWVSGGVVLGAAVVLALAGCTGDPAPIVTELPSASPSAGPSDSASPSPSPSDTRLTDDEVLALLPDGADRADVWGAMVTAQFYAELAGEIFTTGDTSLWTRLAGADCSYCKSQTANVLALYDSGDSASGGSVSVRSESLRAGIDAKGIAFVTFDADVDDLYRLNRAGEREIAQPAVRTSFTLSLEHDGTSWLVTGVDTESEPQ